MAASTGSMPRRRGYKNFPDFAPVVVAITTSAGGVCPISAAEAETIIVNGTTAIVSFGVAPSGAVRRCRAGAAFVITHNATALFCLTGASITTVVNDTFTMVSLGVGNWYMHSYVRATGASLAAGLVNFTEALTSAAPNAAIPVASLTATNAATNVDFALRSKGTGSWLAQIPDSTTAGGDKRATNVVDMQVVRNNSNQVAGTDYGFLIGTARSRTYDAGTPGALLYSGILGSFDSEAHSTSGTGGMGCVIIGGFSNSLAHNAIAGAGMFACDTSTISDSVGGYGQVILGGTQHQNLGQYSIVLGGRANVASGFGGVVMGYNAQSRGCAQAFTQSCYGFGGGAGLCQRAVYVLGVQTTGAVAAVLSADNLGATATGQVGPIPSGHIFACQGLLTATTNSEFASWTFVATLRNNAGTVTVSGAVVTPLTGNDAGLATATPTITADNTNKCLAVTGPGVVAKTIHYGCLCETMEVG